MNKASQNEMPEPVDEKLARVEKQNAELKSYLSPLLNEMGERTSIMLTKLQRAIEHAG